MVFVRPGELRAAEWKEFDLDAAEWRISAERMKMRAQHIVPLSRQALAILRDMQPVTGTGRFVFPSPRTAKRSLSDNGMLAALRRMGYEQGVLTVHGFRSTASTLLNEQGWNPDAIERQLAHSERDGVRAAYNYAEYLPERRKMMQAWSDYLDTLKIGAEATGRAADPAMKTKKRSRKSEDFATGVGRAVRVAAKDARKTAACGSLCGRAPILE
jgi:integrase